MLGKAVTRIASTLAAVLLLVFATVADGHAQGTTGKIQGRVVSADGRPVPSAQVTVEGTNLGNISNDDGFYFINQVSPGLHRVRAQSIGFRSVVVSEQRVLAGQTLTLNFTLEQAAVELEALVVTGERNPLVPRDQVSSKAIVTGEKIDQLPIDDAASVILLQPGIIETNSGYSIRGSREGDQAVYIDGVPVRNLRTGTAQTIDLPTNSVEQVDVTTGGMAARFGNAQAGVVNYVTRSGGSKFGGSISLMTDEIAPSDWRTGFNRGELSLGGPIPGIQNLNFFLGTTLEGRKYAAVNEGTQLLVPTGVDTVIRIARSGATSGAIDSVDISVPNYVDWDNGRSSPTRQNDEVSITGRLTYGIGQGSRIDLSYTGQRQQDMNLGINDLYNPEGWYGVRETDHVLTLGGYVMLHQSAERMIALDVRASAQRNFLQQGAVQSRWRQEHLSPFMGFNVSNIDFVMDPDDWEVTDGLINSIRSGAVLREDLVLFPNRSDLGRAQSLPGLSENLRLNPYAMRGAWPIRGVSSSGTAGDFQNYTNEDRMYLSANVDWQINRFNRANIGGEFTTADTRTFNMPLFSTASFNATAVNYKPKLGALFFEDRLDIGDVVLQGGLRLDYFDPAGEFPRVPGFVFNVPDSLKAGFYELRPLDAGETEEGRLAWLNRLQPLEDCGGAATAAFRTNADGEVVCKSNFIKAKSRTVLSPRLAVSFPVTASSTFRLSYGQNVQAPNLTGLGGMFSGLTTDLNLTNLNALYGRDVQVPRTVSFEAGYRQVFGGNTVVDVAAYSKTSRNSLTFRRVEFQDPNDPLSTFYANSLVNADYSLIRGVDMRFDRRFSEVADLSMSYSFLDGRGTGSDPESYTNLLLRRTTNASVLGGAPEPPEILLPLDQSRAHTLAGSFSLNFPGDHFEDSRVLNAILGDFGVFATMRVSSGLPYTRLSNSGNGQVGPPTDAGLNGTPAEQLNASRTPMEKRFDLRLTKNFDVAGRGARLFADLRNPLGLTNQDNVWLETGTEFNERYFQGQISSHLGDATLDGDATVDDFVIATENQQNAVNKYMLQQAECRFGNCDGTFTVEEQTRSFRSWYNIFNGPQIFRQSNQQLRLGLEFVF